MKFFLNMTLEKLQDISVNKINVFNFEVFIPMTTHDYLQNKTSIKIKMP